MSRLSRLAITSILAALFIFLGIGVSSQTADTDASGLREQAQTLYNDGNYREALALFERLLTSGDIELADDDQAIDTDLRQAINCLQRLNELHRFDEFVEAAVTKYPNHWRMLLGAGNSYASTQHYGYLIAGQFERGHRRGGGRYVDSTQRDRVRALQLYDRAWTLLKTREENVNSRSALYTVLSAYATALKNVGYRQSWRLQLLTDLSTLPDYADAYYNNSRLGAPVDGEGNIIIYQVPTVFAEANNDGERWRYFLGELGRLQPDSYHVHEIAWINFLWEEYGVQTVAESLNQYYYSRQTNEEVQAEHSLFELNNLQDNETIARLANGIQRFNLPEDYRFIERFKSLAESGPNHLYALEKLAEIYENRRQWDKAADYWRQAIAKNENNRRHRRDHQQPRLDQIVGAWAQFEPLPFQAEQQDDKLVNLRFRNAESVRLTAYRIKTAEYLAHLKRHLSSNPSQLDGERINLQNIGYYLLGKGDQYRGQVLRSWTEALSPAPRHQDKHQRLELPNDIDGTYLLEAKVSGGNTSFIVVWNADAIIVKRPMESGEFYYLANAETGEPLANRDLHFFGFNTDWTDDNVAQQLFNRNARRLEVTTKEFSEATDVAGQVIVDSSQLAPDYRWLIHTDANEDNFAFMGFQSIWYGHRQHWQDRQTKAFVISNQPVYRPGQTVELKAWVRTASYTPLENSHANRSLLLKIHNPQGKVIAEEYITSDKYGGISYALELPETADLGVYGVHIPGYSGNGQFRVEEYKKPEYEVVIDKPEGVAALGDTIRAKVKANYYFGAPVTNATVKIKVMRHQHDANWFPRGRWDWLYGRGYWWFACDMHWYPGWTNWGISAPRYSWTPYYPQRPELVQENEFTIGPDGSVDVVINTEAAKLIHGDKDHRYSISAEVVDQSRRSVYASGDVLVARQAFQVYSWVDRGFYQVGDAVRAQFQAQTLDASPIQGSGTVELFRIHYDDNNEVTESLVQSWELDTNDEGLANLTLSADAIGQHRIHYLLRDENDTEQEGGYVFNVIGDGDERISATDNDRFRFNELELIPDQSHYAPGENLSLMINSRRDNANVLLFARPLGTYQPPEQLGLEGNSILTRIPISQADQPNFFIEAVTVFEGKVYTQVKEIAVPPQQSELHVTVETDAEEYHPGETAEVKLTLTDQDGKPFVGATAITVYDKALDYIASDVLPENIRDFYWQWKRYHTPTDQHSANLVSGSMVKRGEQAMRAIGVFGNRIIEARGEQYIEEVVVTGAAMSRSVAQDMALADASISLASPAPAPAPVMEAKANADLSQNANTEPVPDVALRSDFADAIFWDGNIETDEQGQATVSFTMPDNLTTWKTSVWAMGENTEVGQGGAELITNKKLLVRLQAPRFFVEKDEVVLSANVHNYLENTAPVRVRIELDGEALELLSEKETRVRIDANGEQRIDWRVKVKKEGMASIRMLALSDEESDAVAMEFPVYVHGQLITQSFSGALNRDQAGDEIELTIPEQRRPEQTRLELRYSPTLAGAMVDALPYLVDYPYGCTEQTLSRFLPTVLVHNVLQTTGIDLEAIKNKHSNLNAQEIGDDRQRAERWANGNHWNGQAGVKNPVFDSDEVMAMVNTGLLRLSSMQLSDGGWGWFSGWGERSYPHTTAHVVRGLLVAKNAGLLINEESLQRGVSWLRHYQQQELQRLNNATSQTEPYKDRADNIDALVAMVLAEANEIDAAMLNMLFRDRLQLAVYSQAMLALTMNKANRIDERNQIRRNLDQYLIRDPENQTAYLQLNNGNYWWHWYGSEFEAQAYYLKLLALTEPQGEIAPALVKYLLNNRKHASYWNSTRDTALIIEAMTDYLTASGEAAPELELDLLLDGELQKTVSISKDNLFDFDNKLVLEGLDLSAGKHKLQINKRGSGSLYYNAYLNNFSLEDTLQKTGLELKVERQYYKLEKVAANAAVAGSSGQALTQTIEKYNRIKIDASTELQSGDLIEIELRIDSKNDYEYILIEDMKAAGFEPIAVRSGYYDSEGKANELGAYVEYRDNRVAFFARQIARGQHSLSYRMKAEIPGKFSALPTKIEAMYAPELKGNSDENKLHIY